MSKALHSPEDLIAWVKSVPSVQDVDYQIRKLQAVYERAKKDAVGDIVVGSKVRLVTNINPGEDSGWYPYREALVSGATGEVVKIDYNLPHDYWGVDVRLDRCWSISKWRNEYRRYWMGTKEDTPEGFIAPRFEERSGVFCFQAHRVELALEGFT